MQSAGESRSCGSDFAPILAGRCPHAGNVLGVRAKGASRWC